MLSRDRLQSWGPVIGAGLSFLTLGAILVVSARSFASPALAGLGSELIFDGSYYLVGGILSHLFARSSTHFWSCWSRESLELVALLAGTVVFALGAFLQPGNGTGLGQMVAGLIFAPIAIPLNWYWHRRLEPSAAGHHHTGFDTHMKIDAATALLVACAGVAAYLSSNPAWNMVFSVLVVVVAVAWSIGPAGRIVGRMSHRSHDHKDAKTASNRPHHPHR